jgi:hypothetical protein
VTKEDQPSLTSSSIDQIEQPTSTTGSSRSPVEFLKLLENVQPEDILTSLDREIILDMINWCLMDIEGSDAETDEDARDLQRFERRIREMADRLGFKNLKEVPIRSFQTR